MQVLATLVLVSLTATMCSATYNSGHYEGQPCYPSNPEICEERHLVNKYTEPAGDEYGVNVCKTTYLYERKAYSYTYQKYCRKYWRWWHYVTYCSYSCTKTDNCDQVYTRSEESYHCCAGYAVSISDSSSWRDDHHDNMKILRHHGCPIVILPTINDCIASLGLYELAAVLNGTDVSQLLDSANQRYTLLAPSDEVFNLTRPSPYLSPYDVNPYPYPAPRGLEHFLSLHVLNKEVLAKKFAQGQRLPTILPGFFVHVAVLDGTEYDLPEQTGIYVSGAKIENKDACFAENGVVHVINSFIDSSNRTITDIVSSSPKLSIFHEFLKKSGTANLLDEEDRLRTLLAPTDEAFSYLAYKLQLDVVACLNSSAKSAILNKFVVYHVLGDVEFTSTLVKKTEVETKVCWKKYCYWYRCVYECKKISVQIIGNDIVFGPDESPIEYPDIPAVNGVIHYVSRPIVNPWIDLKRECANFPLTSNILIVPAPVVPPPPLMMG